MLTDTNEKLKLAKRKFLADLAALTPPVVKTAAEIVLELVNIKCCHRLYNNTTGAGDYKKHMRNSHRINMQALYPIFTRSSDCKPYKPLDKIKSMHPCLK